MKIGLPGLLGDVGKAALSAVVTAFMIGHEDASTASISRAFTSQSLDLAIGINLVILENCKLDSLMLMLDLLGLSVGLLLTFLTTTKESRGSEDIGALPDTELQKRLFGFWDQTRAVRKKQRRRRELLTRRGGIVKIGAGGYVTKDGCAAGKSLEEKLKWRHDWRWL